MSYRNSAIERYKEITSLVAQATKRLRDQDQAQAAMLAQKLIEAEQQVDLVIEQENATKIGVRLHWEAVVEELYHERWMLIAPMPKPNEAVANQPLAYFDAEVGRTYELLLEALNKRSFFTRKREK